MTKKTSQVYNVVIIKLILHTTVIGLRGLPWCPEHHSVMSFMCPVSPQCCTVTVPCRVPNSSNSLRFSHFPSHFAALLLLSFPHYPPTLVPGTRLLIPWILAGHHGIQITLFILGAKGKFFPFYICYWYFDPHLACIIVTLICLPNVNVKWWMVVIIV